MYVYIVDIINKKKTFNTSNEKDEEVIIDRGNLSNFFFLTM